MTVRAVSNVSYPNAKPDLLNLIWAHGGIAIAQLPPTSEVGGSNPGPYVGTLAVAYQWSAVLQYRTLTNCIYWFPLPTKLPIAI